ncbi:MAG: YicC family protein [Oscillospiraceae bacterium]|nr:YicC family protein [Oscillospiraceae bacterium]
MIKSMTGYGSAKGVSGKLDVSIDVKSVNNRYLDCSVRLPRAYISAEEPMRALVQSRVSRGKVDVYVSIDSSRADDFEISVNKALAEAYLNALNELTESFSVVNDISAARLAAYPDVLGVKKKEMDADALAKDLCAVLSDALDGFELMRVREGERLAEDISRRLDEIERLVSAAEIRSPKTVEEYRQRLEQRIRDMLSSVQIDEARLLTETAIFADRIAVNEEIVRLRSHISQFRTMLKGDEPIGRKLDFLVQELNREANTLGSKGNDTEMARIVVDIKAEIEKIREQIQNIE